MLAVHLLFLSTLAIESWFFPVKPEKVAIQVKTVHMPSPKEHLLAKAPPKPQTKAPSTAKKVEKKVATPSKKGKPSSKTLALQNISQSLSALDTHLNKSPSTLSVPAPVTLQFSQVQEEREEKKISSDYLQELATLFENSLELPEMGAVKVSLIIEKQGNLLSLTVLKSESEKNSLFLKNQLPKLSFPCLNEKVEGPLELTVVFHNAHHLF